MEILLSRDVYDTIENILINILIQRRSDQGFEARKTQEMGGIGEMNETPDASKDRLRMLGITMGTMGWWVPVGIWRRTLWRRQGEYMSWEGELLKGGTYQTIPHKSRLRSTRTHRRLLLRFTVNQGVSFALLEVVFKINPSIAFATPAVAQRLRA